MKYSSGGESTCAAAVAALRDRDGEGERGVARGSEPIENALNGQLSPEGANQATARARHSRVEVPSAIADHLLWFGGASFGPNLLGVITLGWRFEDALADDPWSTRFTAFKLRDERNLQAACALAAYALQRLGWGNMPRAIGVAAAIAAEDERLDRTSRVAVLAHHIARRFGFTWRPDVLRKRSHQAMHRLRRRRDREVAISGAYACVESPDCELIIVCDDFVTTGMTLSEIARAIHVRSPGTRVLGFALARNERLGFAAAHGVALTNDHIPGAWANVWDRYAHMRVSARLSW